MHQISAVNQQQMTIRVQTNNSRDYGDKAVPADTCSELYSEPTTDDDQRVHTDTNREDGDTSFCRYLQ